MFKFIFLFFNLLYFLTQGTITEINFKDSTPSNENRYSESNSYNSDDDFKMIEITLDDDNTVTRPDVKGYENLGWIVKYNGEQVLHRNAENELSYKYFGTTPGKYEIYVTAWKDGEYVQVSNTVRYSIGNIETSETPEMIEVTLLDDYTVARSDMSGYENLGWIVKYNGEQVLHRSAENELRYTYYKTTPGKYEIYVTAWKDGKYVPVSNTVTYTIGNDKTSEMIEITLDDDNTVTRPDVKGYENLGWIVKYNGEQVLHRNAENELSYKYFGTTPGKYEIYVTAWKDGEYVQVSNTVRYSIGNIETSETPEMIEVTLLDDYTVARSDMSGYENLGWIVKYNGEQVLHRSAENELRYTYYKTTPGKYEIYVTAWKDGKYVPVSNTVTYTIGNDKTSEMIEITLDDDNTVTRPSVSGYENLGWIVKYNGEQVLDRNAKNELTYKYYRTMPGTYEIYVTAWKDREYVQISNTVTYTIQ